MRRTSVMRAIGTELVEAYRGGTAVERRCYLVAAVLVLSGLVHLAVLVGTGGTWSGPLSWRKPMTFGLSFGLTVATLTWVLSFLPMPTRSRARLLGAFAAASAIEVLVISVQAWRRRPSHFIPPADATAVDFVGAIGAAGSAVVIVTIVVLATVRALHRNDDIEPSMRLALRVGFLALLAAMLVGVLMLVGGQVITRAQGDVAPAFAFTAVLKPGHAATMHGILVLPALAWLLRFADRPESFRLNVIRLACAGYGAFAAVVVTETAAGTDPLGPAPLIAQALPLLGFAALAAAGAITLRELVRNPRPVGDVRPNSTR